MQLGGMKTAFSSSPSFPSPTTSTAPSPSPPSTLTSTIAAINPYLPATTAHPITLHFTYPPNSKQSPHKPNFPPIHSLHLPSPPQFSCSGNFHPRTHSTPRQPEERPGNAFCIVQAAVTASEIDSSASYEGERCGFCFFVIIVGRSVVAAAAASEVGLEGGIFLVLR